MAEHRQKDPVSTIEDQTIDVRPTFARVLIVPIFALLAAATLIPLWRDSGWPLSHEGPAFALRTHIYARHLSWLDFMPIWSSVDAYGFGSPMPLMYHKLFYLLAGMLALATDSLKTADLMAVALLLVAGATGLYLTMRALGATGLASVVAGCCLITANYTVTNWLVRGALGEFSAAMITPWVLLFFVRTIQSGRLRTGVGLAMGLLWLGHSVLALYLGLILAATYLLLAVLRLAPWSVLSLRTGWPAVLCFVVLVGPYLSVMPILGRGYDFNRILTPPYQPVYQFRPFSAYLWEQEWRFGRTAEGLTVQLDHAMLVLLMVSLWALLARKPDPAAATRRTVVDPILPLLIVVVLGTFLQLPAATPVYDWVPGAAFIQFPWRLLAIITPSLIAAAIYLADRGLPSAVRIFALGGATVWMLVSCGAFAPLQDPRIPLEPQFAGLTFSGFREYEPTAAAPLTEVRTALAARWAEANCSYESIDKSVDEVPSQRFHTSCGRTTALPLPLYASPVHLVTTSTYMRSQPCLFLPEFPSLCGAVIPAATSAVSVKFPTMISVARWGWLQLWAGSRPAG